MKTVFLPFVFCCLALYAKNSLAQDFLPTPTAPPEAAMLGKFGEIPVGNYTGVANISIPLYTIEEGGFEVPVVLRYHSSGIKVEEEATWVGLGWDLTVGGSITHMPAGELDQDDDIELYPGFASLMDKGTEPGFNSYTGRGPRGTVWSCVFIPDDAYWDDYETFIKASSWGWGQPDIYSFSMPTGSGKFFMNPITGKPAIMGAKSNQLMISESSSSSWTLKDLNGNTFLFNSKETSIQDPQGGNPKEYSTASWKLDQIKLASGKTIDFSYTNGKNYTGTRANFVRSYNLVYYPPTSSFSSVYTNIHNVKYLTKVETENIRVEFDLSSQQAQREDLRGDVLGDGSYSAKRLNAIHVVDKISGRRIRTFEFTYDYFTGPGPCASSEFKCKRLKLLAVKVIGYKPDGSRISTNPPYRFMYNEAHPLPAKDSNAIDHWGYFNGESNANLIPNLTDEVLSGLINIDELPTDMIEVLFTAGKANRGMREPYAKLGMLNRITYPTGGYTTFDYEANTFTNYPVFSADEIDDGSANMYLSYKLQYNLNEDIGPLVSDRLYPDEQGSLKLYNFYLKFQQGGDPLNFSNAWFAGSYIRIYKMSADGTRTQLHEWVVPAYVNGEYFKDTGLFEFGKDLFELKGEASDYYQVELYLEEHENAPEGPYGTPLIGGEVSFSKIDYTIHKEESIGGGLRIASIKNYDSDNTQISHKTYKYVNEDGGRSSGKLMSPLKYFSYSPLIERSYQCGSGGYFVPVETIEAYDGGVASYSYYPLAYDAQGAVVGYDRVEVEELNNSSNGKTIDYFRNKPSTVHGRFGIPNIPHEDNGLKDSVVFYAFRNGEYKKLKKVYYHYSSIEDKKVWGLQVEDRYRGPDQCDPCSGAIYNPFVTNGRWLIHYYPLQTRWYVQDKVEEIDYLSNSEIRKERSYSYNNFGQLTEEQVTTSTGEERTVKFRYPIDEALDASYSNTMISSMKAKNLYNLLLEQKSFKGNKELKYIANQYAANLTQNILISEIQEANGAQGDMFKVVSDVLYDGQDNLIQFSQNGLTTSFIWGYGGAYIVAKIENVTNDQLKSVLGSNFTLGGEGGNTLSEVQINNIKSNIPNIRITTYTYSPLIGVKSITDTNGFSAYYEYDEYGRLELVKDNAGNILKKYQYQYMSR